MSRLEGNSVTNRITIVVDYVHLFSYFTVESVGKVMEKNGINMSE
jgi:hypothetical protein